jgi:hypothetical protein
MSEVTVTSDVSGAPNVFRVKPLATTNATLIKSGSGNIHGVVLNATALAPGTPAFVNVFMKFYDTATTPVAGSGTPLFVIPVITSTTVAGNSQVNFEEGIPFHNGIGFTITGLIADSDATAVAADSIHGFVLWK